MKNVIILTTLLMTLMTACSTKKAEAQTTAKKRTLVAYFSATGTTKRAAEIIAGINGADLFAIEPKEAYTDADLDWRDKQSRTTIEMNDPTSRPELKAKKSGIEAYDTVYIGYPIWWYVAPHIINSFVENHDLSGKVLIPFATSGGSPIGPTVDDLRKTYPKLDWRDGKLLNRASEKSVRQWLEGK